MIAVLASDDFLPLQHVLCGLILLGRLGDVISTWLITPKLLVEANPLMRKLGWRFGVLTVLVCFVPYWHLLAGVMLVPPFLMISAHNISKIWMARALGEEAMLRGSIRVARKSKFSHAATCLVISGGFILLNGVVLALLMQMGEGSMAGKMAEYYGFGIAAFGLAMIFHGLIYWRRIFRLAEQPEDSDSSAPGDTVPSDQ